MLLQPVFSANLYKSLVYRVNFLTVLTSGALGAPGPTRNVILQHQPSVSPNREYRLNKFGVKKGHRRLKRSLGTPGLDDLLIFMYKP